MWLCLCIDWYGVQYLYWQELRFRSISSSLWYIYIVLSMFDVNIQDKWQKIRQSWITPLYKVASSSFWMLNTCCETQVLMSEQNNLYVSWHVITSFACAIRQFWQPIWIQFVCMTDAALPAPWFFFILLSLVRGQFLFFPLCDVFPSWIFAIQIL